MTDALKFALITLTDGRGKYLADTIRSAEERVVCRWEHRIMVDDSLDAGYHQMLQDTYGDRFRIIRADHKLGFGGAIRAAWATVRLTNATHIFHLEDDFTFNRFVPLNQMAHTLDAHRELVQLALLRQPWSREEKKAGGVWQTKPDFFRQDHDSDLNTSWLSHRQFFTTNPSLYRRELIDEFDWPRGDQSEGRFGIAVKEAHPDWRFGYWGEGEEWVTHIGAKRIGTGY